MGWQVLVPFDHNIFWILLKATSTSVEPRVNSVKYHSVSWAQCPCKHRVTSHHNFGNLDFFRGDVGDITFLAPSLYKTDNFSADPCFGRCSTNGASRRCFGLAPRISGGVFLFPCSKRLSACFPMCRWLSLPLSIHHLHKQQRQRWSGNGSQEICRGMFAKIFQNPRVFCHQKRKRLHARRDTLTIPTTWKVLTISGVSFEAWTLPIIHYGTCAAKPTQWLLMVFGILLSDDVTPKVDGLCLELFHDVSWFGCLKICPATVRDWNLRGEGQHNNSDLELCTGASSFCWRGGQQPSRRWFMLSGEWWKGSVFCCQINNKQLPLYSI